MSRRTAGRTAALFVMTCVAAVACSSSSSPVLTTGGTSGSHPSPTASTGPKLVTAGPSCRSHAGTAVTFRDRPNKVVVTIVVKKAKAYTGRLASYASAYPPAYGYFVKFPIRLTDVGPGTWQIDPAWFVLHANGRNLTVNDGNGPYSGASHVLAPTFLDPGETDRTNLVIDSPSAHGELSYTPKGKLACTWPF